MNGKGIEGGREISVGMVGGRQGERRKWRRGGKEEGQKENLGEPEDKE